MDFDEELKLLLRELSTAVSRSLSSPENLERLEKLQKHGYDLFLILEGSDETAEKIESTPVIPIQPEMIRIEKKKQFEFKLSSDDKDFLRTLKIKVD